MARGPQGVRNLGFRMLRLTGIPALMRETVGRRGVTIVLYHDPDPSNFERHLLLLRRLYNVIELRAFADALQSGTIGQLPLRSLVVTLDDGHRRNRELLTVLERLQVPVSIFLCASIVGSGRLYWFKHVDDPEPLKRIPDAERLERLRSEGLPEEGRVREALSDQEIREMAGPFVDFQSHGLSHPILPRCDEAKARAEIFESRAQLESRYGLGVYAFSYPNGDCGEREVRLVREAGYVCAITVEPGINSAGSDPYRLKRICIDDPDGIDAMVVKSSGFWGVIRALSSRAAALLERRSNSRG